MAALACALETFAVRRAAAAAASARSARESESARAGVAQQTRAAVDRAMTDRMETNGNPGPLRNPARGRRTGEMSL